MIHVSNLFLLCITKVTRFIGYRRFLVARLEGVYCRGMQRDKFVSNLLPTLRLKVDELVIKEPSEAALVSNLLAPGEFCLWCAQPIQKRTRPTLYCPGQRCRTAHKRSFEKCGHWLHNERTWDQLLDTRSAVRASLREKPAHYPANWVTNFPVVDVQDELLSEHLTNEFKYWSDGRFFNTTTESYRPIVERSVARLSSVNFVVHYGAVPGFGERSSFTASEFEEEFGVEWAPIGRSKAWKDSAPLGLKTPTWWAAPWFKAQSKAWNNILTSEGCSYTRGRDTRKTNTYAPDQLASMLAKAWDVDTWSSDEHSRDSEVYEGRNSQEQLGHWLQGLQEESPLKRTQLDDAAFAEAITKESNALDRLLTNASKDDEDHEHTPTPINKLRFPKGYRHSNQYEIVACTSCKGASATEYHYECSPALTDKRRALITTFPNKSHFSTIGQLVRRLAEEQAVVFTFGREIKEIVNLPEPLQGVYILPRPVIRGPFRAVEDNKQRPAPPVQRALWKELSTLGKLVVRPAAFDWERVLPVHATDVKDIVGDRWRKQGSIPGYLRFVVYEGAPFPHYKGLLPIPGVVESTFALYLWPVFGPLTKLEDRECEITSQRPILHFFLKRELDFKEQRRTWKVAKHLGRIVNNNLSQSYVPQYPAVDSPAYVKLLKLVGVPSRWKQKHPFSGWGTWLESDPPPKPWLWVDDKPLKPVRVMSAEELEAYKQSLVPVGDQGSKIRPWTQPCVGPSPGSKWHISLFNTGSVPKVPQAEVKPRPKGLAPWSPKQLCSCKNCDTNNAWRKSPKQLETTLTVTLALLSNLTQSRR